MAQCELIEKCPFFNDLMQNDLSDVIDLMKEAYCRNNNSRCARHMVFETLGTSFVPLDLLPDEFEKAQQIIHDNQVGSI